MDFETWYEKDENEDWFANEAGTERDIARFAWNAAIDEAVKVAWDAAINEAIKAAKEANSGMDAYDIADEIEELKK